MEVYQLITPLALHHVMAFNQYCMQQQPQIFCCYSLYSLINVNQRRWQIMKQLEVKLGMAKNERFIKRSRWMANQQ